MSSDPRFVILCHQVGEGLVRHDKTHWDWMFQFGESLQTWATPVIESLADSFESDCQRLADHRIAYLEFEGEISGNRGNVLRVAQGSFRIIDLCSDRLSFRIQWGSQHASLRDATATFYRTDEVEDSRLDDNRCGWRLRFSVGR